MKIGRRKEPFSHFDTTRRSLAPDLFWGPFSLLAHSLLCSFDGTQDLVRKKTRLYYEKHDRNQ